MEEYREPGIIYSIVRCIKVVNAVEINRRKLAFGK